MYGTPSENRIQYDLLTITPHESVLKKFKHSLDLAQSYKFGASCEAPTCFAIQ